MRIVNVQQTQDPLWIQVTVFTGDNSGNEFKQKLLRLSKDEVRRIAEAVDADRFPLNLFQVSSETRKE